MRLKRNVSSVAKRARNEDEKEPRLLPWQHDHANTHARHINHAGYLRVRAWFHVPNEILMTS